MSEQRDWPNQLWSLLEQEVFRHESTAELFNLYANRDDRFDRPDAVQVRRENLRLYLNSFERRPHTLLLAEAPGPWGCRFSGVPITSEEQLLDPEFPLSGSQSSLADAPNREYSANIFWRCLREHVGEFLVWNTVPYHPHKKELPMSIRTPRVSEIARFAPVVAGFVRILQPQTVLAIGRKAEKSLASVGVNCTYIRHPSQGGAPYFEEGIRQAMTKS